MLPNSEFDFKKVENENKMSKVDGSSILSKLLSIVEEDKVCGFGNKGKNTDDILIVKIEDKIESKVKVEVCKDDVDNESNSYLNIKELKSANLSKNETHENNSEGYSENEVIIVNNKSNSILNKDFESKNVFEEVEVKIDVEKVNDKNFTTKVNDKKIQSNNKDSFAVNNEVVKNLSKTIVVSDSSIKKDQIDNCSLTDIILRQKSDNYENVSKIKIDKVININAKETEANNTKINFEQNYNFTDNKIENKYEITKDFGNNVKTNEIENCDLKVFTERENAFKELCQTTQNNLNSNTENSNENLSKIKLNDSVNLLKEISVKTESIKLLLQKMAKMITLQRLVLGKDYVNKGAKSKILASGHKISSNNCLSVGDKGLDVNVDLSASNVSSNLIKTNRASKIQETIKNKLVISKKMLEITKQNLKIEMTIRKSRSSVQTYMLVKLRELYESMISFDENYDNATTEYINYMFSTHLFEIYDSADVERKLKYSQEEILNSNIKSRSNIKLQLIRTNEINTIFKNNNNFLSSKDVENELKYVNLNILTNLFNLRVNNVTLDNIFYEQAQMSDTQRDELELGYNELHILKENVYGGKYQNDRYSNISNIVSHSNDVVSKLIMGRS